MLNEKKRRPYHPRYPQERHIHRNLHPRCHKVPIVNHAIHRLLHLPLSLDAQNNEIRHLEEIARRNGLHLDVPSMVRRKSLRLLPNSPVYQPGTKWIRFPFIGRHSYKMEKEMKKYGSYKVGFYPLLTVNNLIHIKDSIPPKEQSGIYHLTCGLCDSQYIGQTGRALATRFSDHRTAYNKQNKEDSAMVAHCIEKGHPLDSVSAELLPCLPQRSSLKSPRRSRNYLYSAIYNVATLFCLMLLSYIIPTYKDHHSVAFRVYNNWRRR